MLQCFWQVLFVGCGWVGACVVLCEFLLAGELSVLLADCWVSAWIFYGAGVAGFGVVLVCCCVCWWLV